MLLVGCSVALFLSVFCLVQLKWIDSSQHEIVNANRPNIHTQRERRTLYETICSVNRQPREILFQFFFLVLLNAFCYDTCGCTLNVQCVNAHCHILSSIHMDMLTKLGICGAQSLWNGGSVNQCSWTQPSFSLSLSCFACSNYHSNHSQMVTFTGFTVSFD